jgi:hypothetical protein
MEIKDLDMNQRTDIDARDMVSAINIMSDQSKSLRVKAAELQREAFLIQREADGIEVATDILRRKLSMALLDT